MLILITTNIYWEISYDVYIILAMLIIWDINAHRHRYLHYHSFA